MSFMNPSVCTRPSRFNGYASWVRRAMLVGATAMSLAFIGDHVMAKVGHLPVAGLGPGSATTAVSGGRAPLGSVSDALVDAISLAALGLSLIGGSRVFGRQKRRHDSGSRPDARAGTGHQPSIAVRILPRRAAR
ncbi:MAG: hypothetical protein NTY02_14190 [Acidobacteria bacterium]|nr:hypothetical protein [Acidobacteriota bacterium]